MNDFIKNIDNSKKQIINEIKLGDENLFFIKNVLSQNDFATLRKIIHDILKSKTHDNERIRYFHTSIGNEHPYFVPHWSYYVTDIPFFNKHIMSYIKNLSPVFKNAECKRIYISFQSTGEMGNWHYDERDADNTYTFTLYCNMKRRASILNNTYEKIMEKSKDIGINNNDDDECGYFSIKCNNQPIIFLRTNDNTAALFKSTALHIGHDVKYNSTNLRCVISYKLIVLNDL